MTLENILMKEKDSSLFNEEYFLELISQNKYDTSKNLLETLTDIKESKKFKEQIYTLSTFINYKQEQYKTIITQIQKDYSEYNAAQQFDMEVPNWVDEEDMKEEGYENEHDYYRDFYTTEAQNVIYSEMIVHWQDTYNNSKKLFFDDHCNVYGLLEDTYNL